MDKQDILARLSVLERQFLGTLNLLHEIKTEILDSIEADEVESIVIVSDNGEVIRTIPEPLCRECYNERRVSEGDPYFHPVQILPHNTDDPKCIWHGKTEK